MENTQTNFVTLILSLAASVQTSLGILPDPQTKKVETNLKIAKDTIDLLDILKEKTKGNLTKDEEDLFEHLMYELRMKFVEVSKKKTETL